MAYARLQRTVDMIGNTCKCNVANEHDIGHSSPISEFAMLQN